MSSGRPWHDVGTFFRERFGVPVRKVLVNTGLACPTGWTAAAAAPSATS